jgi:hypothetical protein
MVSASPAIAASGSSSANYKAVHSRFSKLAAASHAAQKTYKAGEYIVRLKAEPASTYTGGIRGFLATKPSAGKQLNSHTDAVKKYAAHLKSAQQTVLSRHGVKALYSYALSFNGFSANLTAKQAVALSKDPSVSTLTRSAKLKVQADPEVAPSDLSSIHFLHIDAATGLWSKIGGPTGAGKGIVLGDIDTGIAPENPSFAGATLATVPTGTAATDTPTILGNTVQYKKADGGTFTSPMIGTEPGWANSDLSTKIIAAHFYVDGFGTANLGSTASRGEYVSPRDGAGHGSHTASTAAGDYGVDASVLGQDFGGISGVAPAAKIAIYKVCWDGTAADESLDGCTTPDILAAVEQAVTDGVDVLNYSIGGGGAVTTFSPTDEAFFNAASAGIFVSAAAGNAGPDASTLDNAAPWETTVAASTIPSYEATIKLGNNKEYAGASIGVSASVATALAGKPLVDAKDIPATGVDPAVAENCGTDTLDPVGANGKIVICEREGVIARLDKSATVKAAGGIGMILINSAPNDVDTDAHTIPTIHVDFADRAAIEGYADGTIGATASFLVGNVTPIKTPAPQVAGFSSRGPVLAAGSDILKPDVAAPGVGILAAVSNKVGEDPSWDFYSGTSMATPHVAGLALDYLTAHPHATVAEIKSALMTTASNTLTATGKGVTDAFAQGDGQVNPTGLLTPGLLYLSTVSDWKNYLYSVNEVTHSDPGFEGAVAHDPSNLNLASIAIGDFLGTQTVTRTVTAQQAGTYTATASVPGITSVVSPSKLVFTAVGQTKSFTVKFTRGTAGLDAWKTGFLTWTKSGSTLRVRSDIAIHPTSVQTPANVNGVGRTNSVKVPVAAGANLSVEADGLLAKGELLTGSGIPGSGPDYTGTAVSPGHLTHNYTVQGAGSDFSSPGSEYLRFNVKPLLAADNATSDLDLYVAYFADATDVPATPTLANLADNFVAVSATTSADETADVFPTEQQYEDGGVYVTYVDFFDTPSAGIRFVQTFANLTDVSDDGDFQATPYVSALKTGVHSTYTASWDGLDGNSKYIGIMFLSNANYPYTGYNASFFNITTLATIVKAKPTITGTAKVGNVLTEHNGLYDSPNAQLSFQYNWKWAGSSAILPNGTGKTYTVTPADIGHQLTVVEIARLGSGGAVGNLSLPTATVKATSGIGVTLADSTISTTQHASLALRLHVSQFGDDSSAAGTSPAILAVSLNGKVVGHAQTGTLVMQTNGTLLGNATRVLGLLPKGTYQIVISYPGTSKIAPISTGPVTLKVS